MRRHVFVATSPYKGRAGVGMGLTRKTNPPPSYPSLPPEGEGTMSSRFRRLKVFVGAFEALTQYASGFVGVNLTTRYPTSKSGQSYAHLLIEGGDPIIFSDIR